MSKKVLIISSTSRKGGNSELLAEEFAAGAKEAGNEVELLRLRDYTVGFWVEGIEGTSDDAQGIFDKMMAADVIVFASPVYFYSICAQLKALFDRSVAIFPNLTGKTYYFIIAMADTDRKMLDGPIKAMQGFLDCYDGSTLAGMVCADGVYEAGTVKDTPFMNEARELGKSVK